MQSAREPGVGRAMAASDLRVPAANRTLVWFSAEAERRRRAAAAAQGASSRHAATESGWVGLDDSSSEEIRRRAEVRRIADLTALFRGIVVRLTALPRHAPMQALSGTPAARPPARSRGWRRSELLGLGALLVAMVELPVLDGVGPRPCLIEPMGLAPGTDLDVKMIVSHNTTCAVWSKTQDISVNDPKIAVLPQHGTLAVRGRSGVTYQPAHGFIGQDRFAFSVRGPSRLRGQASLVRVDVNVR